eukprot:scaffold94346_cov42-Prasinocladus_malaysianus.AAC.1
MRMMCFRTFAILKHQADSTYASGEKYGTYLHLEDLRSQARLLCPLFHPDPQLIHLHSGRMYGYFFIAIKRCL